MFLPSPHHNNIPAFFPLPLSGVCMQHAVALSLLRQYSLLLQSFLLSISGKKSHTTDFFRKLKIPSVFHFPQVLFRHFIAGFIVAGFIGKNL